MFLVHKFIKFFRLNSVKKAKHVFAFLTVKVLEFKCYFKKLKLKLAYFVSKLCFKFNELYYKYRGHQFYDTKISYVLKQAVIVFVSVLTFISNVLL